MQLPFIQSSHSTTNSDSVAVAVELSDGVVGYGECCPRPYVTGEDANSVMQEVSKTAKLLKNHQLQSVDAIREFLEHDLSGLAGPSTVCAIEAALLDAFCKHTGAPVTDLLGFKWPEKVQYSGVVPMLPITSLTSLLPRLRSFGFKDLKLKVGTDLSDSLERVELVKNCFGEDIQLRIDANCSWDFNLSQVHIPALYEAGIRVFEQIFPPEREQDWASATALFGHRVELMADESVTNFESAKQLIEKGIGNRFNLKISKQGGIFNALKISDLARSNGIPCQLGAHYGETTILTTCGIMFSALTGQLAAMEGAFGNHLLTADICATTLQFDHNACIESPGSTMTQHGIGYEVIPARLDQYSV